MSIQWYGYRHVNDTFHTKRYFGPEDITEAEQSKFVVKVNGPFFAPNVDQARRINFTALRKYP